MVLAILFPLRHWPRQPQEERGPRARCAPPGACCLQLLQLALVPQISSDLQTLENPSLHLCPPPLVIPQKHEDVPKR